MTDTANDYEYATDGVDEEDDFLDGSELEVKRPTEGTLYNFRVEHLKAGHTNPSEKYPSGQKKVDARLRIEGDEEFDGLVLFHSFFLGTAEDPSSFGREDFNQFHYALTGERITPHSRVSLKQMVGDGTNCVRGKIAYRKDQHDKDVVTGLQVKMKSWVKADFSEYEHSDSDADAIGGRTPF